MKPTALKRGAALKRRVPLETDPDKNRAWRRRAAEAQKADPDKNRAWRRRAAETLQLRTAAEISRGRSGSQPKRGNSTRTKPSQATRAEVRRLDGHRCRLAGFPEVAGRCLGQLTYHHRRKASALGAGTVANGATLCSFHNCWVETVPDRVVLALDSHLIVRPGHPEWDSLGVRAAAGRL